jgi:hypothetical protein
MDSGYIATASLDVRFDFHSFIFSFEKESAET